MGHGQACKNHPDRKVLGCCHVCGDWLCKECLQEGPIHYYCRKPSCSKALKVEAGDKAPRCPSCGKSFKGDPTFCPGCGFRLKPVGEDEKGDLVTIMRFNNSVQAQLARTKLESEGLQAFVYDEHLGSYIASGAMGGIRLKTAGSQVEQALKILGQSPRAKEKNG